jgi:Leu/Phe-tRNA-protein transferase
MQLVDNVTLHYILSVILQKTMVTMRLKNSNNADLGKEYRGGMFYMAPRYSSFFIFSPERRFCVALFSSPPRLSLFERARL